MSHSSPEHSAIHPALRNDHRHLDALFDQVVGAAEAGFDLRTLGEIWTRFDTTLRSHFAAEEALVFPALQEKHPNEVARFLGEHDDIRARLDALDIAVDLHFVRARQVRELVELVRAHAVAEDARLYRWAESEVPGPTGDKLLLRLEDPNRWRQGGSA
ncbi:MAG: iron-sulfur cluster repair protein YtfE (RIC family) [Myxococcota bacterium]|jgi:iron-sulfur cluster repair protein YtfE (RIC family)